MGSKRRITSDILPIILNGRTENQWYVEPFCGGCNSLDKVDGLRIGADNNKYLISLLKEMQKDQITLPFIGEKEYRDIKNNKEKYPDYILGYVGIEMSFGAKWFGGYRRDKAGDISFENEQSQNRKSQNSIIEQSKFIKDVKFYCCDYWELDIPDNSIIYCDPPYYGTTRYKDEFNHEIFWKWCEQKTLEGNKVFVSEYHAPDNWEPIWSKQVNTGLDVSTTKIDTENLFVLKT